MKYLNGLKVRFGISIISMLAFMFNAACLVEYYGLIPALEFYGFISLNFVIMIVILIYTTIIGNKMDEYNEKRNKR